MTDLSDAEPALATLVVEDAGGPPLQEETAWMCEVLDLDPGEWQRIVSVSRSVPPYDIPSALVAFEIIDNRFDSAFFSGGFTTNTRLIEIPGDVEGLAGAGGHRLVEGIDVGIAFKVGDDATVVARFERDQDELRLVTYALEAAGAEAGQQAIADAVRGKASTWRHRPVLLDPTPASLLRTLPDSTPPPAPPTRAETELRRSIIDPVIRILGGADEPASSMLVIGPAGTGKSTLVRWMGAQLSGRATTLIVPPRIIANPDLLRLAFELASDDAPSLLVLEHLDLLLGDRFSMRYPESLAELATRLDRGLGDAGVFVLATALQSEPLDEVLLSRLARRIQLGDAPQSERRQSLTALVDHHADGDAALLESLVKRTQGWTIGRIAELGRLADHAAASGESVELTALVRRVLEPIVLTDTEDGDGTYL